MTPTVDGVVHHFESRGLYDGVSILWDQETETIWNHVTGEAMHGPLLGKRLGTSNLFHMNVEQTLAEYPEIEIAISDRPVRRETMWGGMLERIPVLRDRFRGTMPRIDTRRPDMELGLGVWVGDAARYYPLETIISSGRAFIDELGDQRVLIYLDPVSRTPVALLTDAMGAEWDGGEGAVKLENGFTVRAEGLFDSDGVEQDLDRPMQLFTRWYGFALMFENVEIYEGH